MKNSVIGRFFRRYWRELLCFIFPIVSVISLSLIYNFSFILIGPDAELYLSIADNFLATGHFIETVRGGQWVVPFGVPLILTVFRALHMTTEEIVVFQYALMGLTTLLVYKAERNYFGWGGIAPIVYFLMIYREALYPRNIFVEHYFLFFLALIFWLLSRRDMPPAKRLLWLNAAGFAAYAVRPVLIVVYVPILIYTLLSLRRGQISGRRAALLFLVPALIMGVNTAVNHRETGHWIFSDNYAGGDIYIANNPYTKMEEYISPAGNVGPEYDAVQADETLDFTEKNQVYKDLTSAWIRQHLGTFLKNTATKFYILFIDHWRWKLVPPVIFAVLWSVWKKDRLMFGMLCLGLLLAGVTSIGLTVPRYTIPLFPLVAMQYAAGWALMMEVLRKLWTWLPWGKTK